MLKLNLLPPKEKKDLELAEFSRLIASLAIWFLIFLIIFTLLLTSSYFSLSILLEEQKQLIGIRQSNPKTQDILEIEEKIKQTNQTIKQVYIKQKEIILWAPILEEMTKIVPSGIYLTNFFYQSNNNQITLIGWANQRENLLHFQKSLKESSSFKEVKAPLANLIKQKDIDFSFTLKPVFQP